MITRSAGHLQVSGEVTMATVSALYGQSLFSADDKKLGDNLLIDLGKLEKVDSSAVSLMLAWTREARRNQIALSFVNVPNNLMSLARLYGVAELLTLAAAE